MSTMLDDVWEVAFYMENKGAEGQSQKELKMLHCWVSR